jgi:hypothetical protein
MRALLLLVAVLYFPYAVALGDLYQFNVSDPASREYSGSNTPIVGYDAITETYFVSWKLTGELLTNPS